MNGKWRISGFILMLMFLFCGCGKKEEEKEIIPVDLTIYTADLEDVCRPIVKEYEERTGKCVKILSGDANPVEKYDVYFAVEKEFLDERKDAIEEPGRIDFSVVPIVIMYNTNAVEKREVPTGWKSLSFSKWKGRIAFSASEGSEIWEKTVNYAKYIPSGEEVSLAVKEGRYFIGIIPEKTACRLKESGANIEYIYPEEGTVLITYASAVLKESDNKETAWDFLNFTVSKDAQRILTEKLHQYPVRQDVKPAQNLIIKDFSYEKN